jgi:hypothetical protein
MPFPEVVLAHVLYASAMGSKNFIKPKPNEEVMLSDLGDPSLLINVLDAQNLGGLFIRVQLVKCQRGIRADADVFPYRM